MATGAPSSESTVSSLTDDQYNSKWLHIAVTTAAEGPFARITLTGKLDRTTTDQVLRCVTDVLSHPVPATLQIDARALSFLDSSGVRCLLICRKAAAAVGRRLILTDPTPNVYQVLEITGLLDIFDVPRRAPSAAGRFSARNDSARPVPDDRAGMKGPMSLPELVEQSAQLRRIARETRQRAQAARDLSASWGQAGDH